LIKQTTIDDIKVDGTFVYLCKYAGVSYNTTFGDQDATLPSSDDVSAPMIDWKTGTTVQDAMTNLMELSAHHYYFDAAGTCRIYELDEDGLPPESNLGPDWEPYYPNTKVMSVDYTPDFEDIRNEMLVIGLRKIETKNRQEKVLEPPIFPYILQDNNRPTNPEIPWSKNMVQNIPGFVDQATLQKVADNLKRLTRIYELVGRTQIPGNASIKPYDKWGDYIITSVTHNLDMENKTWVTDIEFASGKEIIES